MNPTLKFIATIVSSDRPAFDSVSAEVTMDYRPHVSESALVELYRGATAMVLTSQQEGLGIAAMEAMACGLPVISTRCGGPETFIRDCVDGFLVDAEPGQIAERMSEIATDVSLRRSMGSAAEERIETSFSQHVWNPAFDEMIEQTIHNHN
jgi:glycosyltransferase involved in cell wall biosynthesis